MNSCKNGSEHLFLSRKRRKQRSVLFTITKSSKRKMSLQRLPPAESATTDDDSCETASELSEMPGMVVFQLSVLEQVTFPDFFNDKPHSVDLQQTLERYDKVCKSFNDNEEVELYLVRKESVLSNSC